MITKFVPIVFILSIFIYNKSVGQRTDYVKGWYVSKNNDTIWGYGLLGKKNDFSSFAFKTDSMGIPGKIDIINCKSVNFGPNRYVVWVGKKSMEYVDNLDVSLIRNKDVYTADTIPLELVYDAGDFAFYQYNDEKNHYFLEAGNTIEELRIGYDYLTDWEKLSYNGKAQIPTYWIRNRYKSQIMAALNQKFTRKKYALMDRTTFDRHSLLRLFKSLARPS